MLWDRCLFVLSTSVTLVYWMDQDSTWYGGRPRPRRHCVRWGSISPRNYTAGPHFSAYVYCGQTVVHLSNCWALVLTLENLRGSSKCSISFKF